MSYCDFTKILQEKSQSRVTLNGHNWHNQLFLIFLESR